MLAEERRRPIAMDMYLDIDRNAVYAPDEEHDEHDGE